MDYLKLKKSNCKNCYKCIRNCPVKSIQFSGNQAHVLADECILCGQCYVVCPQNAREIVDSTEKAKVLIDSGEKVIASIAPSFTANYNGLSIIAMETALKKLGFYAAEETALGATIVKKEYEKITQEGSQEIIISSCCHTVNLLIQKYFPDALKYLANVITPMQAHCIDIKKRYPGAKTVFIGPCLSKKDEGERYPGIVDCVLTFEELTKWLDSEKITFEDIPDEMEKGRARIFPTAGGIIKSLVYKSSDYSYLQVDGIENCISALMDIINGGLGKTFIEMSACKGSCIGGPIMQRNHNTPIHDYQAVERYSGKDDFKVSELPNDIVTLNHQYIENNNKIPGTKDIEDILKKIGKTKPEDELNCGSCGYDSCREKAIAVYQGKADLTMCLPYLKEKAESFSDNIIRHTSNAIVVLNKDLEVQQINEAALKLMNLHLQSDVLGEQVIRILDPVDFINVLDTGKNMTVERRYLIEYDKYVDQTIIYDKNYQILICIMRDVTDEEKQHKEKKEMSRQTVETTDKVIDKQMRVVQEIAYLLGETAAETKIALTKLKESLDDD